MDQRKLIKLGNSSFAIALPKDWVDKSGLKKGDNVFVTPNSNGELIIQTNYFPNGNEKKIVLDLNGREDKDIEREISSAYIKDYNVFEVIGLDKSKRERVEYLLKSLISLEIIEKGKEKIVAKDFFDLNEVNVPNFLRRIDNSLRNMLEEVAMYLKKGAITDKELKEIYSIDWDINRLYFLIYRMFIKTLNNPTLLTTLKVDNSTLLNTWQIAVKIEEVGDEIKRICKILSQSKKVKTEEKILPLFLEITEKYIELLSNYYNKDSEGIKKATFYKNELTPKFEGLSKNKDPTIAKIAEKFKHISSSFHEVSKLLLYTVIKNEK